jgi:hypothetical protein
MLEFYGCAIRLPSHRRILPTRIVAHPTSARQRVQKEAPAHGCTRGAPSATLVRMKAGMWNLGFGILGVLAGASGRYELPGTSSSTPLMIAGGLLAVFGLIQLVRSRGT